MGVSATVRCLPLLAVLAGCSRARPPAPATGDRPRLVSLAPSLTELVCAIGAADALVGRTSVCNYPADTLAHVPVVGGFGEPSMERLVAARPTVVVEVDLADETMGRRIDALGLRRERIPCSRLDDVPKAARRLGELTGRRAEAEALAAQIERGVAALRHEAAAVTNRPGVFVEIWHDPVMTVGGGSFLSELVWLAGGSNVAAEVSREYFQVSGEWVVARNPDAVLCLYMGGPDGARAGVGRRPGWSGVAAVARGAVYDGFENDAMLRPGPRVLEGIEAMRRRIRDAADRRSHAGSGR
jgi:iron complex transport system substrate-binding protein